jgi:hypothetical protein
VGLTRADIGRRGLPPIHQLALGIDGRNLYAAIDEGLYRLRREPDPE